MHLLHAEPYFLFLFGLGAVILLVAWLPLALKRLPLSLPIICVLLGFLLQAQNGVKLNLERLFQGPEMERMTEAVVVVALMGTGLRLDRRFGLRRWASTWRLLLLAMPLTIALLTLFGTAGVGWPWPVALLLAAALAPTDPVLAADVQTGPPGRGEEGEVRFGLTSEAGLNDGLAWPFITLALIGINPGPIDWAHWVGVTLLLELAAGALLGWAGGRAMAWLLFHVPRLRLSDTRDGLVAVGITLMAYATALVLHANGFVAVFVCAATIRRSAPEEAFHHAMSEFSEQVERVLVMLVLVVFGWGLGAGLLDGLTWPGALLALALIFVFRPLAAWVSFAGTRLHWQSRALMAFFGIRGIGTLFYLLYGLNRADFPESGAIVAVACFAILVSVVLHGVTSTPLMALADRMLKRHPAGSDILTDFDSETEETA